MASVRLQAWVEGDPPNMCIDLILDRPDITLHDQDSERTFLYQAIVELADLAAEHLDLGSLED
jgi:hypothetical protein